MSALLIGFSFGNKQVITNYGSMKGIDNDIVNMYNLMIDFMGIEDITIVTDFPKSQLKLKSKGLKVKSPKVKIVYNPEVNVKIFLKALYDFSTQSKDMFIYISSHGESMGICEQTNYKSLILDDDGKICMVPESVLYRIIIEKNKDVEYNRLENGNNFVRRRVILDDDHDDRRFSSQNFKYFILIDTCNSKNLSHLPFILDGKNLNFSRYNGFIDDTVLCDKKPYGIALSVDSETNLSISSGSIVTNSIILRMKSLNKNSTIGELYKKVKEVIPKAVLTSTSCNASSKIPLYEKID